MKICVTEQKFATTALTTDVCYTKRYGSCLSVMIVKLFYTVLAGANVVMQTW